MHVHISYINWFPTAGGMPNTMYYVIMLYNIILRYKLSPSFMTRENEAQRKEAIFLKSPRQETGFKYRCVWIHVWFHQIFTAPYITEENEDQGEDNSDYCDKSN